MKIKSFKTYLFENAGNSVKVDVFHGSGRHFDQFEQKHAKIKNDYYGGGIGYFTDNKDVAKSYAKASSKETKTPHLYHTSLNMSNVFDTDHHFSGKHLTKLLPKDTRKFATSAGLLHAGNMEHHDRILNDLEGGKASLTGHQLFWGLSHGGTKTSQARDHLIKYGYDGLRYTGGLQVPDSVKHNVYIPYNADSIKINHIEKM